MTKVLSPFDERQEFFYGEPFCGKTEKINDFKDAQCIYN